MVQQVRVLVTKLDNLSSYPKDPHDRRKELTPTCILTSTHPVACLCTHVHVYTNTYTNNKKINVLMYYS